MVLGIGSADRFGYSAMNATTAIEQKASTNRRGSTAVRAMKARTAKNGSSMSTTRSDGTGTSKRRSRGPFCPTQKSSKPETITGTMSWRIQPRSSRP